MEYLTKLKIHFFGFFINLDIKLKNFVFLYFNFGNKILNYNSKQIFNKINKLIIFKEKKKKKLFQNIHNPFLNARIPFLIL